MREITLTEAIRYEVRASWWTSYVTFGPLQRLAGSYFAWKVGRKYRRYKASMEAGRRTGTVT